MGSRRRNFFVLLFVAALVVVSALVVLSKPTRLGLDLRGGTELIYQGRPTPQNPKVESDDVERSIEIIRDRTDSLGVAEPEIQRVGADSLRVSLPDVQNADRAIEQVGDTAQLQFYDWEPNIVPNPNISAAADPADSPFPRIYDAVTLASTQRSQCESTVDGRDYKCTTNGPTYYLFDSQTKQLATGPASARADLLVDQSSLPPAARREVLAVPQGVRVVKAPSVGNEAQPSDPNKAEWFVLRDRPELTGDEIRNPEQQSDPTTNQPVVAFEFTDEGRRKFAEVTRRIAERGFATAPPGTGSNAQAAAQFSGSFAVILDGEVKSRAIINFADNPSGIDGRGGAQIEGGFGIQEAQDLAEVLKIGALPIELKLISQSTVSASLGAEALDQGLKAGAAGLILVVIFLLVYYRFLGFVAVTGLAVYGLFFYSLMKAIPVTLTLPGIAGLILTIGVAADANVVIFERIKEEARQGRSMLSAITAGYRKGIATIIDANVIILITAFILFVLATAGVKGFAFTLGLGTIASLFTAVVFTQAFLGIFGRSPLMSSPAFLGAGEQRVRWSFDFIGLSRWFFSLSGVILAIGAIGFATLQLNLGLDFTSGTRIEAGLDRDASVEQVRSTLDRVGVSDAKIQQAQSDQLGQNAVQIQTAQLEPDQVGKVQVALEQDFGVVEAGFNSTSIGPTFGQQVGKSAILAVIFSLLVITAYVAFRFEPKYAVPVIIALIHDVLITGGVYSLTGKEVSSATVAAFLTILGYSMYDTVIVFDRIRENVPRLPSATFSQIVNRSMSEVLTRSLITGLSSVFLIGVLLIFGGATLKDFAFAMMVGIASGTYSSIFIASPVLTAWKEREPAYRRRRERIEELIGHVPAFPDGSIVARLDDGGAAPQARAAVAALEPEPARAHAEPAFAEPELSSEAEPDSGPEPQPRPAPADSRAPEPLDDGNGAEPGEGPKLSEASAEALRRAQVRRTSGKKRRKHGRR